VKTRKKPAHIGIGGSFQGVVAGLDLNLNLMTLRDRWNSITGVVVFLSPKAIYHWEQELVILASSRRRIWWQTEPIHSDIPNILVGLGVLEDFFRKKSTPPSSSQEKLGEKKGIKGAAALFQDFICSSGHVLDSDCQIQDLKYRYVRSGLCPKTYTQNLSRFLLNSHGTLWKKRELNSLVARCM
jgi:hypothetical protein